MPTDLSSEYHWSIMRWPLEELFPKLCCSRQSSRGTLKRKRGEKTACPNVRKPGSGPAPATH